MHPSTFPLSLKRIRITGGFLLLLGVLSLASCTTKSYWDTGNGVIVRVAQSETGEQSLLKVEVVTDRIIRVSATPEKQFPERESLAVIYSSENQPGYTVSESAEWVEIATANIRVTVDPDGGRVRFTDQEGNPILEEPEGGGRSFAPITVEQSSGYSFRQVFESPEEEAFYGLGQHQSDEWNYKGKNEVLYQYNTKVSIPFVVSSRNYGILWDNYSLTKFGIPEAYSELSQFTLYDSDGNEGGLTATYVTASGETFLQRTEKEIDYENLSTVGKFPEDFPFWESDISWEGALQAATTGEFEFKLYYAGYTRVIVDGEEVVPERWRTAWNPNTYKFRVRMTAGEKVPVQVLWRPDGGVSYIGLKVLGPIDPTEQGRLSLWSEMGRELDYYFIRGEDLDQVISGYRTLTGKAPIMPQWAYGFWQSRERYRTQEEIVNTLGEFRKRDIGIDNIVQDWSYWEEDQWGSHEFDPERFPDPKGMIRQIHDMNARIMISVWPKFYINTQHYKEFSDRGWIYKQAVEDSIRDWIARGYIGSFYDPYAQGARELFWDQINEHLYSLGIDAWWMDASEPDILSNSSIEYRKKLCGPTAIGSSTEFFNTYSLVNAEGIYNGQRSVDPNKRVFLLTRSGFAGLQRYSTATWSGDIGTRWEDMKAQISAGLNFALSGIPYWTMDIGGFCVEHRYERAREGSEDLEEWRELNTRWYQFGTFAPLYRSHGQYPYREVFNLAPETHPAYQSIVSYNRLRYRLMPYIYSLAGRIYFDDYTLMRALVMDFAEDSKCRDIGDQYMFGPSLMICPVYEYKARERGVYFPAGQAWYDLQSGEQITGGQKLTVAAPYENMPIYVKAGAILPAGPEIRYVGEKPPDPITLYIYPGADGEFTLYEDEGVNYNYEKGDFSRIPFAYDDSERSLTIGERKGSFEGMVRERKFNIVTVKKGAGSPSNPAKVPDHSVTYTGEPITISL